MSLTRKMLKAMSIEDEKIEQIIEAHSETVDGLKAERDSLKAKAAKADELQTEVDELKAQPTDDYKAKFEALVAENKEREKAEAEKALKAEKSTLYEQLLKDTNVNEKYLATVLKATDLNALEIKDGALVDTEKLQEVIKETWADFISTKETKGAETANPPEHDQGYTKDQVLKMPYKERARLYEENPEVFNEIMKG